MTSTYASAAALAVLLSSTASGQTLLEFRHDGTDYVGIPVPVWEEIVAKRIGANQLNRERRLAITLLVKDVADADAAGETYRLDAIDAKKGEAAAYGERDEARAELDPLKRKVRNRTPWARAGQGVALYVAAKVVQAVVPGALPWLP